VDALPSSTNALNLNQTLTLLGISLPIHIPLTLGSGSLGVVINLLN